MRQKRQVADIKKLLFLFHILHLGAAVAVAADQSGATNFFYFKVALKLLCFLTQGYISNIMLSHLHKEEQQTMEQLIFRCSWENISIQRQ